MKPLKIGDRVSFLSSSGGGRVLDINKNQVLVEDENGFENFHDIHDLVLRLEINIEQVELKDVTVKTVKKPQKTISKKEKDLPILDLHIENLTDSHRDWSNHEIVTFQLRKLDVFLNETERNRLPKVIVVHGVGSGKLKSEIQLKVRGIPGATMHDCHFMAFGKGASVIERKFNWK
ncbi:MAG: hypothetical protein KJ941_10465 [Bacteroidetes bacterium]|nr:hypothetical protein [Bacteroidota bacterium]